MKTQVEERFTEFYEEWLRQLEEYLQQLLRVSKQALVRDQDMQVLVSNVTSHHKQYYTAKWGAAREDVLAFFCPVWFSSLENAYSWVTDWKPSVVFKLIDSMRKTGLPGASLGELSGEQLKRIEELRLKIRLEEERVEREMERQQVAMADRKMVELARLASQNRVRSDKGAVNYQVDGLVGVALTGLMGGLERVMKAGDCVRLKTLKGVLDLLSPLQCVDFLAATCMLHVQLRKRGKTREHQNGVRSL